MKIFFSGLKFGLLLQLAIGPMCLMVFNTARNTGFLTAFSLVLAISLVDAFYITLSCLGTGKLLDKSKYNKIFKILGGLVLIFFGFNMILNIFGVNLIPGLNLKPSARSAFIQGLVLTLSNPMTIIFWTGILVGKIIEDKLKHRQLFIFSLGLISASLIFMTSVAILGTTLSTFIPYIVSNILNVAIGLFIIFFGIKLFIKG